MSTTGNGAWIPPGASYGDNPSGQINQQNPWADASRPFVQGGETGGWQDNVGVTRRAGTSQTQGEYDAAIAAARNSPWAGQFDDWLARNPDDPHRFLESMRETGAGGGGGGATQSPTQAWNSQPSAGGGARDALIAQLMARAQQGTAVDRNNPNIRAQVDPAVAQLERSSRGYLDDVAERAGPLANIQGERRLASERTGQAAGTLEAEVIGREIAGRRAEIMQALSLWGDQLSDQQRIELQRELGYLDDATRRFGIEMGADTAREGLGVQRYGIDVNNDQFLRDLALREWEGWNRWDPTNPINLP
jgi:hypothetical protein